MDCIFCKIVKKEIPSDVIFEDEAVIGILDIHPRVSGHTLVIPKNHTEFLGDVSSEKAGALFEGVKGVISLLEKKLAPEGFTIGINHGKIAGQEVPHLHIHIMPRWGDDGGGCIQSIVHNQRESVEETKKKILS